MRNMDLLQNEIVQKKRYQQIKFLREFKNFWYYNQYHCNIIVEITIIKCGLLSKHLLQCTQQNGGCTKPLGNDKFVFLKKILCPVITQNKKHSSKQVVSMIDTLGKDFLQILKTLLLRQNKKYCVQFSHRTKNSHRSKLCQ